jgi:S-adenosylmethionine synthetase
LPASRPGTVTRERVHQPAGDFALGGPEGDNGLSGKKLVVDAYGPRVPIGGGALSGKDLFKADRAGALLARRVARAVVATGVAGACTSVRGFHPGAEVARILSLRDERGEALDPARWARLLDLSLAGAGERYTGVADLVEIARWGHFTDPRFPWERVGFDPRHAVIVVPPVPVTTRVSSGWCPRRK